MPLPDGAVLAPHFNHNAYMSPLDLLKASIEAPIVTVPPAVQITNVSALGFPQKTNGVLWRKLQNVGTTAIKVYCVSGAAVPSAPAAGTIPHFIVPGGTSANDGTGGQLDLSQIANAIWVDATGGGVANLAQGLLPNFNTDNDSLVP